MTFAEIDGLVTHLIENNLTEDETLLGKIYVDLGITGGNIFKIRMKQRANVIVHDPYPSGYVISEIIPEKSNTFEKLSIYLTTLKEKVYGFFGK